ncbi:hypothetical protein JNM87_00765 [Candidatus Saccharibacteria bacterium]|nr:hypothetical protein [Candidatus Saccharibacteria bacterium]
MKIRHINYALIAITVLSASCLLASGFVANQLLSHKSSELSQLKAQSQVVSDLQATLKKNRSDLIKYKELNEIAKAVVPQDKNQAQTVGEIVKIAEESGISQLSSITFPASTLGGVGASSSGGLTQVTPVKGINGVFLLPITITQDSAHAIKYSQFITFLSKLENNRRTAQVSSISIQPDSKNPSLISFNLTVNEYIKP